MAFVEHKPKRMLMKDDEALNSVRVNFKVSKNKSSEKENIIATFYVGINVAKKIGLKKDDKVSFFYDDEKIRHWMIKKSNSGSGYKLVDSSSEEKETKFLRFQMTWRVEGFEIKTEDFNLRKIKHETTDSGEILLNAEIN